MLNFKFNNETFEIGDFVKVTYLENGMFNNHFYTNIFELIEIIRFNEQYGFYLETIYDDIPFVRVLKEKCFSNLIIKIEKYKN